MTASPADRSDEQIEADLTAYRRWASGPFGDEFPRPDDSIAVDRLLADISPLLARAQKAEFEAVERLRQFNAAKDQRDAALADADRLRAELAEAKAENQRLIADRAANEKANIASRRSICEQSDRYKAELADVKKQLLIAWEAANAEAVEHEALRRQMAAVREQIVEECVRAVTKDATPEVWWFVGEAVNRIRSVLTQPSNRAALDGTEQDGESR